MSDLDVIYHIIENFQYQQETATYEAKVLKNDNARNYHKLKKDVAKEIGALKTEIGALKTENAKLTIAVDNLEKRDLAIISTVKPLLCRSFCDWILQEEGWSDGSRTDFLKTADLRLATKYNLSTDEVWLLFRTSAFAFRDVVAHETNARAVAEVICKTLQNFHPIQQVFVARFGVTAEEYLASNRNEHHGWNAWQA